MAPPVPPRRRDLSWPGMAPAVIIVTFPFVGREVIALLEGDRLDRDEAAHTLGVGNWQVFCWVTLPLLRWTVIEHLIRSTARALGDFGAMTVVSGDIAGPTQTLTLPQVVDAAFKPCDNALTDGAALVLGGVRLMSLLLQPAVKHLPDGATVNRPMH